MITCEYQTFTGNERLVNRLRASQVERPSVIDAERVTTRNAVDENPAVARLCEISRTDRAYATTIPRSSPSR